jgi:hypothetical protein
VKRKKDLSRRGMDFMDYDVEWYEEEKAKARAKAAVAKAASKPPVAPSPADPAVPLSASGSATLIPPSSAPASPRVNASLVDVSSVSIPSAIPVTTDQGLSVDQQSGIGGAKAADEESTKQSTESLEDSADKPDSNETEVQDVPMEEAPSTAVKVHSSEPEQPRDDSILADSDAANTMQPMAFAPTVAASETKEIRSANEHAEGIAAIVDESPTSLTSQPTSPTPMAEAITSSPRPVETREVDLTQVTPLKLKLKRVKKPSSDLIVSKASLVQEANATVSPGPAPVSLPAEQSACNDTPQPKIVERSTRAAEVSPRLIIRIPPKTSSGSDMNKPDPVSQPTEQNSPPQPVNLSTVRTEKPRPVVKSKSKKGPPGLRFLPGEDVNLPIITSSPVTPQISKSINPTSESDLHSPTISRLHPANVPSQGSTVAPSVKPPSAPIYETLSQPPASTTSKQPQTLPAQRAPANERSDSEEEESLADRQRRVSGQGVKRPRSRSPSVQLPAQRRRTLSSTTAPNPLLTVAETQHSLNLKPAVVQPNSKEYPVNPFAEGAFMYSPVQLVSRETLISEPVSPRPEAAVNMDVDVNQGANLQPSLSRARATTQKTPLVNDHLTLPRIRLPKSNIGVVLIPSEKDLEQLPMFNHDAVVLGFSRGKKVGDTSPVTFSFNLDAAQVEACCRWSRRYEAPE